MNIGLAATYCELKGVNPRALDLEDKLRRVLQNERASLTTDHFLSFIDVPHINLVYGLHWMRVLVNYVPELVHMKAQVNDMFRTRVKKTCIPEGPTPVYPLSSSGKCETVTTELKDAMHDFLAQVGQSEDEYLRRLVLVGGDGLTFQRLLEVQKYLQFHTDDLESLRLLEPILAVWHTEWTDVSRIYETFWDSLLSPDPSTLGHSAAVIGRPGPSNLKKVDYYTGIDLMYTVLDARMLDCWRIHLGGGNDIFKHFVDLAASNNLPDIHTIETAAHTLHHMYSSTRAMHCALSDTTKSTSWTATVPLGSRWTPHTSNPTSAAPSQSTKQPDTAGRNKKGDRVLSNTIGFMRDAILSREVSYAIAEGDAGRVYEIMKVMLFSFSGSSHTKYCTYLLEVITRFELESSLELREAILKTTLINLTGRPGSCIAADIMQEYFNRLLEAIVEKKGLNYGDTFARRILSPNLGHFARIKLNLRSGVGLAPRSGRHTAPHTDPEIRKLLHTYLTTELHTRRPGRVYQDVDRDNFSQGIVKLRSGRLSKWVFDTTYHRNITKSYVDLGVEEMREAVEDGDAGEDGFDDAGYIPQTLGVAEVIDGQLVIGTFSPDEVSKAFDEYMADLDETAE